MKARFYDPYVGRFLQPDTLVPDPANPSASGGLNRYSYVLNNPLRYTDPTGQCHVNAADLLCLDALPEQFPSNESHGPLQFVGALDPAAPCAIGGDYAACPYEPIVGGPRAAIAQQAFRYWTLWAARSLDSQGYDLNRLWWSFDQRWVLSVYGFGVAEDPYSLGKMIESEDEMESFAGFVGLGLISVAPKTVAGPEVARSVYDSLKSNDWQPLPGIRGGRVYENRTSPRLPEGGQYREYDVLFQIEGVGRGSERIVIDISTGRAWYTSTHYAELVDLAP